MAMIILIEIRISGFQGGISQRTENTAKNSLSGIYQIFTDQALNQCLPCWQADSLPLSHQRSPTHARIFLIAW